MSSPIVLSYTWSRDNVEKLFDALYTYEFNHSIKRYIGWFFIALSQYAVIVAVKKNSFALLLFSTLMLVYWYYGKKMIAKKRAFASYEKSPFKDKKITIRVDNNVLTIQNDKEETWTWQDIDRVVSLDNDIIIYKTPYAHYIPSSAFKTLEEKSLFKTLAKKNGKLA
jgi:hypothetical protein